MLLEVFPSEKVISQLFDHQPDAVVWLVPIFSDDNGVIIDFEVKYCNAAASKLMGEEQSSIIGKTLLSTLPIHDDLRRQAFEQYLTVWKVEKPVELTLQPPNSDRYYNVQRSKVMNGILSITRDRTADVKAEQQRNKQSILLNRIINNSPTCIVLCEALRDENEKIYDFKFLMVNDKIVNDLKKPKEEILSMTYCTLHPGVRTNGLIDILANVVDTGEIFREEVYFECFGGWFHLSADRVDTNKVIATYLNINQSKNYTQKLEQQAQWYNNILKYSTNGIIALKSVRDDSNEILDFEITLCNPAGYTMSGLPNDAVGKMIGKLIPQFLTTAYIDLHRNVVEQGVPYKNLIPFNVDSSERWFQVSLSKLEDGLVSNLMDVTELKQHEKTIEIQAQLLDLILNSSLNGIYSLSAIRDQNQEIVDFKITHVNHVFSKLSNKSVEELIGKSYIKTFPHVKPSGVFERNCNILKTREPLRQELHYKGDGVDMWLDTSVVAVNSDQLVISFNDITALKKAAKQLEDSNNELKKSNDKLSEFTHVASHDLSEPLRKIMTFTQMLNDRFAEKLDADVKGYLTKINKTAYRMQALITDLLTYSHISNSIQKFETVSLQQITEEVLTDLEALIALKEAQIFVSDLPSLMGDKTQLRQVFQNLITNAVKFQKENNIPIIKIGSKTEVKSDWKNRINIFTVVEVEDNGIGFEQEQANKIFQLFQRLHGKNEFEGTGIGLAIVQKAMENHNGWVEVKSEPGKGSCFKLFFPKTITAV